jgi:uncharacterized protein YjbI with pentapeptide repeats
MTEETKRGKERIAVDHASIEEAIERGGEAFGEAFGGRAAVEPSPTHDPEEPPKTSSVPLWLVVLAAIVLGGVVEVIIYGYLDRPGWVGVSGKKFWDYLELLIVPAALAIGVAWLNWAQRKREREAEKAQQARERVAEEARRKHELEVESQRAQDEALQAYLDQMSQLLTDEKRPLHRAQQGDSLSTVARARTLTVLSRLDGGRKGTVVRFLYESRLIVGDQPILSLQGADLQRVVLEATRLSKVNLKGAILSYGSFTGIDLSKALLTGARLNHTDFVGVNLSGAILRHANLSQATLRSWVTAYSSLLGSLAPEMPVRSCSLAPEMPVRSHEYGWYSGRTRLKWVDEFIIVFTTLSGADLSEADLRGADLRGASGFTNELLQHQASMLRGATMPDGQKYEDWLFKSKRRGGGANSGPS